MFACRCNDSSSFSHSPVHLSHPWHERRLSPWDSSPQNQLKECRNKTFPLEGRPEVGCAWGQRGRCRKLRLTSSPALPPSSSPRALLSSSSSSPPNSFKTPPPTNQVEMKRGKPLLRRFSGATKVKQVCKLPPRKNKCLAISKPLHIGQSGRATCHSSLRPFRFHFFFA